MEFKEAEEVMEKYELKEVAEKDFNIATYGSTGKMQLALKFKIYAKYARKRRGSWWKKEKRLRI